MKLKLLHNGMKVFIDPRSSQTEKDHGFTNEMRLMLGTTRKINKVYGYAIIIGGYDWSPEDLSLPHDLKKTNPVKKYTPVLFNPKELVL